MLKMAGDPTAEMVEELALGAQTLAAVMAAQLTVTALVERQEEIVVVVDRHLSLLLRLDLELLSM